MKEFSVVRVKELRVVMVKISRNVNWRQYVGKYKLNQNITMDITIFFIFFISRFYFKQHFDNNY